MMKISDVLKTKGREVQAIEAGELLSVAVARFGQSKIRCLAVTEGGKLVGMLTIRDTLLLLNRRGEAGLSEPVREAMTGDVAYVTPESELGVALEQFLLRKINHLPVVADGELTGLVTRADLLASQLLDAEGTNEYMQAYISGGYL